MASRSSNRRLKGVTKSVPIIAGTLALWQGKKADEQHTHKWSCYVRGLNNEEDISYFVKKVVFQLHPSFPEPVKTVEKYPFEIHQTGWGEFEIGIKIYFNDPAEKPVEMIHYLKLHPDQGIQPSTKKPVVNEKYDEIVFSEPTESFAYILDRGPKLKEDNKEPDEQMIDIDEGGAVVTERKEHTNLEVEMSHDKNMTTIEQNEESKAQDKKQGERADEKHKPIDRRQYGQFLQIFSDDNDLKVLNECLEYVRQQVQQKREELIDIEKQVNQSKKMAKEIELESHH